MRLERAFYKSNQSPNAQNCPGILCIPHLSSQGPNEHNFPINPFIWLRTKLYQRDPNYSLTVVHNFRVLVGFKEPGVVPKILPGRCRQRPPGSSFSLTADFIFRFFIAEAWGERRIMFWKFKGSRHCIFLYKYI